jgi:predicted RNase H-like nuclease (RuvC/YqgF family)
MSSIGRVFIVLNLLLAGIFVAFAGLYLQRADDWKLKHETVSKQLDDERKSLGDRITQLSGELAAAERNLRGLKQTADNFENQVKQKTEELAAQETRLAEFVGEVGKLQSSLSTMQSEIANSNAQSKKAYEDWMKADREKVAALQNEEKAKAALGEAEQKIAGLERTLADANAKVSSLDSTVKEQEMMLGIVRGKFPGLLGNIAPTLDGRVANVSPNNDLVTIQITNNPAGAEIKPGYAMAVWDGSKYKGEVTITEVKDDFVFGRVTRRTENASVSVGDRASTNPAGN